MMVVNLQIVKSIAQLGLYPIDNSVIYPGYEHYGIRIYQARDGVNPVAARLPPNGY